ncbi:hypothetical protein F5Y14DRAFT_456497 [Nemania sp. NC0429]|nr:hypothetical protein F5Y14DRAFT_456497 [Nemania sp. NC0429]
MGERRNLRRDFFASTDDIPVLLPPPGSPYKRGPPSLIDMGKDDPDTIQYFNIRTNNIPAGHEDRIKKLEEMLDLTHQWLDIHAGKHTGEQKDKGTLPSDDSEDSQLKRSNYRIKVLDTIMDGNCPWIMTARDESIHNQIRVKKAEFHATLIKDIMAGITTVKRISTAIEQAFQSLSNIIVKTQHAREGRLSWSFFNVFTWDDVTQDVKGSIRIVLYKISGEMAEYVINKLEIQEVRLGFDFHQAEYLFSDYSWGRYQTDVEDFLEENGRKKIREPVPGSIDP